MCSSVRPWVVLKFGGTSVSSRPRWEAIADVVEARLDEGLRPFLVCSAMAGISRALDRLLNEATREGGNHHRVLEEIRTRHIELGAALEIDAKGLLGDYFEALERWSHGASLTQEAPPRLRARTLACGEFMSTTMGAAFLQKRHIDIGWQDVRKLLTSESVPPHFAHRRFLSATCASGPDYELQRRLRDVASVIVTQGFIARDPTGETVLLGWGGSDTSAAYLASHLEASRLEIWTDVPGMFTANPRKLASARHLLHLGYNVAQEMASAGAEVLHPRSIGPAARGGIPIHIRSTDMPGRKGTVITEPRALPEPPSVHAHIKGVVPKRGLTLLAIESRNLGKQVDFLARLFDILKEYNVSIGLVATSETHVTVVLDPAPEPLAPTVLRTLIGDLEPLGTTRVVGSCAAVSIIGHDLQAVVPDLGPAFELVRAHGVHLVSQEASGLNLTFLVDEDDAEPLTESLHAQLFDGRSSDDLFGPSWSELLEQAPAP